MKRKLTTHEKIVKIRTSNTNTKKSVPHEIKVIKLIVSKRNEILLQMILSMLKDESLELHFVVKTEKELEKYKRRVSSGIAKGAEKILGTNVIYGFDSTEIVEYEEIIKEIKEESEEEEFEECSGRYRKKLSPYEIKQLQYNKYSRKVIVGGYEKIQGNVEIRKPTSPTNSTLILSIPICYDTFVSLISSLHTQVQRPKEIRTALKHFKTDFLSSVCKWVRCIIPLTKLQSKKDKKKCSKSSPQAQETNVSNFKFLRKA